jgi:hypothetical protein
MQLARQRLARNEHIDLVALQRAAASPDLATSKDISNLQRALGNQAVSRLLAGASPTRPVASRTRQPLIQAQPETGPVGDDHQKVTDRAAAHRVSAISSTGQQLVQRNGEDRHFRLTQRIVFPPKQLLKKTLRPSVSR